MSLLCTVNSLCHRNVCSSEMDICYSRVCRERHFRHCFWLCAETKTWKLPRQWHFKWGNDELEPAKERWKFTFLVTHETWDVYQLHGCPTDLTDVTIYNLWGCSTDTFTKCICTWYRSTALRLAFLNPIQHGYAGIAVYVYFKSSAQILASVKMPVTRRVVHTTYTRVTLAINISNYWPHWSWSMAHSHSTRRWGVVHGKTCKLITHNIWSASRRRGPSFIKVLRSFEKVP